MNIGAEALRTAGKHMLAGRFLPLFMSFFGEKRTSPGQTARTLLQTGATLR